MNDDLTLIEQQSELKREILLGKYRVFVDRALHWISAVVQRLSRNPRSVSFVYSALLVSVLALLTDFVISLGRGEFRAENRRGFISIEILIAVMIFALLITLVMYFRSLFQTFHDRLIDSIQNADHIADLRDWLASISNSRNSFLVSILCALGGSAYFLVPLVALEQLTTSAIGTITLGSIFFFVLGAAAYYFIHVLVLVLRLSRYDLKVYELDPRNSAIVEDISNLVIVFVYSIATFMAVVTTALVFIGWATLPAIAPATIATWILIVILFAANQFTLTRIVTRAKWKTLNNLQAQIQQIHSQADLAKKENAEAINRLMDLHDRIRGTPNSTLNFRASLGFINSLLLPLLAFLLSTLGDLLELIGR